MGITNDVFDRVKAPRQMVVIAVTRTRREQLEFTIQTALETYRISKARNGTKYIVPNKSTITVQVQGNQDVDVDTTGWKSKEWKEWISDLEEDKEAE